MTKHSIKANGIDFHNELADCWSTKYGRGGLRRRNLFFKIRMQECVRRSDRWLDAGSGSGVLSRELGQLGADVVAVDGSLKMIKNAKLETDISHGRIFFKTIATIEDIDEPDASFDGVLCSSVIEYINYPDLSLIHI